MVKVRSEYTSVRDCINLPDTPENAPTFECELYTFWFNSTIEYVQGIMEGKHE